MLDLNKIFIILEREQFQTYHILERHCSHFFYPNIADAAAVRALSCFSAFLE